MTISKHLVNSPVVVLSADYGWTAQMEKVMKSQAFADQSKFEFMKSKRMFEVSTHGLPRTCALATRSARRQRAQHTRNTCRRDELLFETINVGHHNQRRGSPQSSP